jgi:phosphatidylinositol-3-phosphatase
VLENHEYGEVIGSPEAPFLNGLARRGALATRYYAVAHPSLPNYLALLGGSTFGVDDNCTECSLAGDNLAAQLSRAGISWRAYVEGLPSPCYRGSTHGRYVKRHNPFMYFRSIFDRRDRCRNVVPATDLGEDLRSDSLPAFSWVTPDLCHDGHDCGLRTADSWLARLVPRIARKLGPGGFLVVTFDEGTSDRGCCGGADGGRVATIVAGPRARHGARLRRPLDHYSLLATIEAAFGAPRLRHARGAPTLAGALARWPDGGEMCNR